MITEMCGMKLIDQKTTKELMQMLGIAVAIARMVKEAAVRWYGRILWRNEENILKEALNAEVTRRRIKGRTNATSKNQVEALIKYAGLKKDALSRKKWQLRNEVNSATVDKNIIA